MNVAAADQPATWPAVTNTASDRRPGWYSCDEPVDRAVQVNFLSTTKSQAVHLEISRKG